MLSSQPTFQTKDTWRYRLGSSLFLSFWLRVAGWIEIGVHMYKNADGHVPVWFLKIFDLLLWTMWGYHDYVHSKLFGRGDGR